MRVNYVGELGWELHHDLEYQNHIFDALMAAGADLGLKPFGIRAMDSLRYEKSYRMVGTEMSIEYAAYESGLDRFIHPDKGDFIGREALLAWQEEGFANAFATLEVHDVADADALGNNPIYLGDELVGRATGGNYGFRIGKSLALAMLRPDLAKIGTELRMTILDSDHKVTVIPESPYDPANERLRS
jgi:dimethylglycine dehydrogenase